MRVYNLEMSFRPWIFTYALAFSSKTVLPYQVLRRTVVQSRTPCLLSCNAVGICHLPPDEQMLNLLFSSLVCELTCFFNFSNHRELAWKLPCASPPVCVTWLCNHLSFHTVAPKSVSPSCVSSSSHPHMAFFIFLRMGS